MGNISRDFLYVVINLHGYGKKELKTVGFQFFFSENLFFHKIILNPIIEPYTDRWIGKSGYPRYDDFMLSLLSSVENNSGIAEYLCSETLQLRASAIGFAINSNMFSL